jgi:acyl-coenzyme A synthetase/AMP-(fatty) acid ligase
MPSIPLLKFHHPESVFAWQGGKTITAQRFLTDVIALAERLPARAYVLNLCNDRYRFMVGFAAAMLRGQISLLPPSHTSDLVKRLTRHYAEMYCLTDGAHGPGSLQTIFYPDLSDASLLQTPMPEIPDAQVAAIVFTSGSTGDPMPNEKTWGALSRDVTAEANRLGILDRGDLTLLGTVPPQHMYGFESTALIAMQGGVILHAAKPFFPADIRAILNNIPGPRALITTPVHLRALLASNTDLPELELIVCATAPLSRELALQAVERFGAPLQEIYGFTEAGQVASRETAKTEVWRTFDGLTLHQKDEVTYVSGGHVVGELPFSDITELQSDTTFLLHGRTADLINIAGKRTSLASLNHHLNEIDGVQDGVFFMPDEQEGNTARLAAFVVAPELDAREILKALRLRIDPVFLPRPIHKVDALPRNSTGKLPRTSLDKLLQQCRQG